MERQPRVILISGIISAVIGLVAGFIGGRFAPHPTPTPAAAALMQAQAFKLVDQAGRERGGARELMLTAPPGWRYSVRTPPCPW